MGFFKFKQTEDKTTLDTAKTLQVPTVSYSMPIISPRFSSPAASAYVPESFFAAAFKKF